MHVLLTDVLTCPRCGPTWPLILLAERVDNRRILEGTLGCPNCQSHFRIEGGFADLRIEPAAAESGRTEPTDDASLRMAALLGITEGPALALIVGAGAVNAPAIARLVPGLEVVAAWPALAEQSEEEGVTRVALADVLPFRNGSMRAVAVTDATSEALIEEAARVVAPRGRVVVFNGDESTARRLEAGGLRVLARDQRATVAARAAF